jgi:type II secretory pathway component PulF
MDFKRFTEFIGQNLDLLDKDDVKYIIGGDYTTLFNKLNEKYKEEQDPSKKAKLEKIAIFLDKFIKEYNSSSYKFSYEKCEVFEHFNYWFDFYLLNNFLKNAEQVIKDMELKFPTNAVKIEKLKKKMDKVKWDYDKEAEKLRQNILKKNKFKTIEMLIWQTEYGKAMYEALELLQEFPNDPQIKTYLQKIDALKSTSSWETIKISWDFFEKVWLLSLTKSKELKQSDIQEIYKKLKFLKSSRDYDAALWLISYIKDKYKIEDKNLLRFQSYFVEAKSKVQLKQQEEEYTLEYKSLKLLMKNKQYKEALWKANTILKKYALINKKNIFNIIQQIDRERKLVLNQKSSFDRWFMDLQMRMASLNKKSLASFYEKMAWFLNAKMDLKLSLQVIYHQSKDLWLKKFVKSLLEWVDSGMKLSEILRWYSIIWKQEVAMIKIWETTWKLWDMFKVISDTYKENESRKKKIKSVMIYPWVVITVTILIFIWLIVTIIPKFVDFFGQMKVELPIITRALIWLSDFFVNQWYLALWLLVWFIIGYKMFSKTQMWDVFNSWMSLNTPIVKQVVYRKYVIHLAWNISLLLRAWISLLEALDLVIYWSENVFYREEFRRLRFELETWVTFAKAIWLTNIEDIWWYANKLIPIDLAFAVDIWEKTWQVWAMLGDVAERYDEDLKMIIKNLNNLLEPFIIVLVWWIVFLFVMAIFMPLMSMYDSMWDKM